MDAPDVAFKFMSSLVSRVYESLGKMSDTSGRALATLATVDIRDRPRPLPARWRTAGADLTSRVLSIRDPLLRPTDRLRWQRSRVAV